MYGAPGGSRTKRAHATRNLSPRSLGRRDFNALYYKGIASPISTLLLDV
jgi:hypothetical protein